MELGTKFLVPYNSDVHVMYGYLFIFFFVTVLRWPSGTSVRLCSGRLGFDSESSQTFDQ